MLGKLCGGTASVLDYGDVMYRKASPSYLKPEESIYHPALRFITPVNYKKC